MLNKPRQHCDQLAAWSSVLPEPQHSFGTGNAWLPAHELMAERPCAALHVRPQHSRATGLVPHMRPHGCSRGVWHH